MKQNDMQDLFGNVPHFEDGIKGGRQLNQYCVYQVHQITALDYRKFSFRVLRLKYRQMLWLIHIQSLVRYLY